MLDNLEQTAEKKMVPLIFLDMLFNGKARYRRLDTGEVLEGKVGVLMQDRLSLMVDYSGKGTIRMKPVLEEADGLLFPEEPKPRGLYKCNLCKIHPEEEKQDEKNYIIGGFSIPLRQK